MSKTATELSLKDAIGWALGERLRWAIVVAHTEDGWEVVRSTDENGKEFDLLRVSQEFQLALRGLMHRELERLNGDGEAKEETP